MRPMIDGGRIERGLALNATPLVGLAGSPKGPEEAGQGASRGAGAPPHIVATIRQMAKVCGIGLALVVLLWGRLPAQTSRPEKAAEPKGQIGGVVSSAQTGEALKGAMVSLRANRKQPNDDTPQLSGVTLADGKFLFLALPAGIYDLDVSKSGYHSRSDSSRRITLQDGQSVLELTTRLSRPGVIAGRVLDTNGDPLLGLRVQAWRRRFRNGMARLEPGGTAISDDHGEYRVFDLPAGKYIVGVSAAGAAGNSSVLTMEYADVFHPNASQPSALRKNDPVALG